MWANAFRYLQKNIFDWTIDSKNINVLLAVRQAADDNDVITMADVVAEPGKKRPVKINYIPPVCTDNGDENSSVCDAGTALAPVQDWFEVTQYVSSDVYRINEDDLRLVDGNYTFSQQGMNSIRAVLPTVREKLSNAIAAMLVAETGVLYNGHSSMPVSIMNAENAGMNPVGFYQIQRQYELSGYSAKAPYIVGGSAQVDNWLKSARLATDNTSIGISMGKARPAGNLFYDPLINTTYGDATAEHILSFSPDMLKFVSYSSNAGIFATDVTNIAAIDAMYQRGYPALVNGGLIDPRTGLLWDLNIMFHPCDDATKRPYWTFQFGLNWDIYFLPPRICNVQGLNSIFHFTTCLEQEPTCGSNPYPSPAVATVKTGNASGLSYPLVLQTVVLNGQTIYDIPNSPTSVANITELQDFLNNEQGMITLTHTGTDLKYTGFTDVDLVINGTTTISFS